MAEYKAHPVDSFENLRDRVERFVLTSARPRQSRAQMSLLPPSPHDRGVDMITPRASVAGFLGFMSDAMPKGDIYLFGGVLRDLALLGRRGFNSDIDLVVEGDWDHCIPYLQSLEARKNKFGGYRLSIGGWPIDIWNARDTWAIRQGLVEYRGIASLTQTTVLNWDAILMSWRTRRFIYRDGYLVQLKSRLLDVVLEQNPNPLGMAVRVFRHLSVKDARQVTPTAATYLANCTARYSFEVLHSKEIRSYGDTAIELPIYRFFEEIKKNETLEMRARFEAASECLKREGIAVPCRQSVLMFDNKVESH